MFNFTYSSYTFEAVIKPIPNGLFCNFFFYDVFQLFSSHQFLKLEWFSDIYTPVWQHAERNEDKVNALF